MPRYVVLRHDPPPDSSRSTHWDLMLESGEVLRTWALEDEPSPGSAIAAIALADHRKAYLEYEGPVSRNRGYVTRWDSGTYEPLEIADDRLLVDLSGTRLHGKTRLIRHATDVRHWRVEFA